MENKYNCGHKGCPLNHMCRKIHQAAFGPAADNTNNNHHRRSAATAEQPPPAAVTVRVIDIQSKPPPQPQPQHNRAAAVSFKPQLHDGGGDQQHNSSHQRSSGVHVEDRFSDYIGRVRKKLRTLSTVGGGGDGRYGSNYDKRGSGVGTKDNKFSDYISHVKNKFTRTTTTATTPTSAGKTKSWIKY